MFHMVEPLFRKGSESGGLDSNQHFCYAKTVAVGTPDRILFVNNALSSRATTGFVSAQTVFALCRDNIPLFFPLVSIPVVV